MAEIKEHQWYNGTVLTTEEAKVEFQRRLEILSENNNQWDQLLPEFDINPNAFNAGVVHRDIGDNGEEEKVISSIKRDISLYVPGVRRYTEFFSTNSAGELFQAIIAFAKESSQESDINEKKYKVNLKISSGEDIIQVEINILKVEEGMNCVEMVRKEGDRFEFMNVYKAFKYSCGGLANASL